jgi:hypothetical protein
VPDWPSQAHTFARALMLTRFHTRKNVLAFLLASPFARDYLHDLYLVKARTLLGVWQRLSFYGCACYRYFLFPSLWNKVMYEHKYEYSSGMFQHALLLMSKVSKKEYMIFSVEHFNFC